MVRNFKFAINQKKRLFLCYGIINFVITNSVLQISLFLTPVIVSTILSHAINIFLGIYFYGKKVFKVKVTNKSIKRYILLSLFLWVLNFAAIKYMYALGVNKNFAALCFLPILVSISYFVQNKYVFPNKFLVNNYS